LFIKKAQLKKTNSSGKRHDSYFFGPNIASKKVWVPTKKYEFQKKKELILVRAQGCAKKVWVPKQIEFPQKRNSYFLGPNIVPKKVRVPKKI
jgi:hypothetical protein